MPYIPSILSGSLPQPQGPYPVGYYTLTHAPLPGQGFVLSSPTIDTNLPSNAKAFGSPSATPDNFPWKTGHVPALGLRRVEYSVWYPCEVPKGWFGRDASPSGVGWLPKPVQDVLDGYARFANDSSWISAAYPLLRVLGGRITIPVHPAAKPLETTNPPLSTSQTPKKPPLIIFSHGLAGTHLTYSHVCRALASQGNVVLSISHQDGSGPVASVPTGGDASCGLWAERAGAVVRRRKEDGPVGGRDGDGKGVGGVVKRSGHDASESRLDSTPFKLSYLRHNELEWSPDRTPDVMTLRSLQLDIRVHELYATYASFRRLITHGASSLPGLTMSAGSGSVPQADAVEFLDALKGTVDVDSLDLVGHSFGGGTVLWALQRDVPEGEDKLPVKKAVALDPWVEPMPMPAPVKGNKDAPDVPLFVINSSRFTLWSTHFSRLNRLIRDSHGTLLTLIGARHESFSDFPLLVNPSSAYGIMTTIDSLVGAFLRGDVREHAKVKGKEEDRGVLKTTTKDVRGKETGKRELVGEWGDVVVHELGRS